MITRVIRRSPESPLGASLAGFFVSALFFLDSDACRKPIGLMDANPAVAR